MRLSKSVAIIAVVLSTSLPCCAQHFPLRDGEWVYTSAEMPDQPMLFCINDELFQKGLNQNPDCKIRNLTMTSGGASYSLDCPLKSFQMTGTVTLTFDGQEHMLGKADINATVNGKTTTSHSTGEYRWKSSQCSPNDMNLQGKKPQ
jgi:hypothetical protein